MLGDKFVDRADFLSILKSKGGSTGAESAAFVQERSRTEEERAAPRTLFLAAIDAREKRVKAANDQAAKEAGADYSKGFSGSAADTKAEKDFAKLALGDDGQADDLHHDAPPEEKALLAPLDVSPHELEELRALGKWVKIMGGSDCWIWVHPETREVATQRPDGFVDEEVTTEAATHDFGGLPWVEMEGLLGEIDRIVDELKKTPLLIDTSFDRKVGTYFGYKVRSTLTHASFQSSLSPPPAARRPPSSPAHRGFLLTARSSACRSGTRTGPSPRTSWRPSGPALWRP
jgi:hypothetical protein